jgi:hypothetical protein
MRLALAVFVAFYSILALGYYHEAAVVSPMQVIMGLSIIPMCIIAVGLLFSGLMGLSSKEARTQNIVIVLLAAALLVVVGYREFRRSNRPRSEASPYNPQAGAQNGCMIRAEGLSLSFTGGGLRAWMGDVRTHTDRSSLVPPGQFEFVFS